MLIARAPLRISLAGGGTDLPAYYERYGGLVVSTTIDKFVYVHIGANGAGAQITSADYQTFYRHHANEPMGWNGELALPRAVLHEFGLERGTSIFLASEVPPGTGLGSSSAIAVALVQGVANFRGRAMTRQRVAELASRVELEKLRAPIGKQDQFAAAFGGLNAITFASTGVTVEPLLVAPDALERLQRRLLLFFTGTARDSATILKAQQRASAQGEAQTLDGLHRIKEAARACRDCLEAGDLDGIGILLHEGWQQKRRLAPGISNQRIDELYDMALANGALGGKITGAGGGGFLLLYCHEARQEALTEALEPRGLRRMDFHFEERGVTTASVRWDTPAEPEATGQGPDDIPIRVDRPHAALATGVPDRWNAG
jgi:D-glycero-alpha-D-manno-heptose-7-phosphate kinase